MKFKIRFIEGDDTRLVEEYEATQVEMSSQSHRYIPIIGGYTISEDMVGNIFAIKDREA